MITVHHLDNSRSHRVLWLLEELAVPYELKQWHRDPRTLLAPDGLRQVHPLGKAPVLQDGPRVLAESGAILEYLADMHDPERVLSCPSRPVDADERLQYRYWMHYAEGSAMPPLLLSLVFSRIASAPMPFFARPIARRIAETGMRGFVRPQLKRHLEWMEQALDAHLWFAGPRFTVADIQMSFPVQVASVRGGGLHDYPRLQGFLDRIAQRPAYQRAIERGGALSLLGDD